MENFEMLLELYGKVNVSGLVGASQEERTSDISKLRDLAKELNNKNNKLFNFQTEGSDGELLKSIKEFIENQIKSN